MSAQIRPPDGFASSSSLRGRALRLTRRGQAVTDLKAMRLRENVRQTLIFVLVSAVTVAAVSLIAGGPWPLLFTAPVVAVVLLLASRADSKAAWQILVFVIGAGIAIGAAPLWAAASLLVGVLLRRRITWAVRRSRPRSLVRSTPLYVLIAAGPRRGVALRYGLVRLRGGDLMGSRDLFTFVLQQPRRRGDKAARAAAHIGLAVLARETADITAGLAHTQAADELLSARRPRRLADRLMLERGLLLHDGARHGDAVDVLEIASKRLWRGGDRRGAVAALTVAASSAIVQDPHKGLGHAASARDLAVRAIDLAGLIRTELLLAQAAIANNDNTLADSSAHSVLDLAEGLAESYLRAGEDLRTATVEQATAQGNARLVLARVAAGSGDDREALEHAKEAIRLCGAGVRGYDTAAAELIATEILERQGRQGAALRHALTAVAHLDRARYLLPTPRWRNEWTRSNETAYGHALRLATLSGDSRLVAELVETARLQAVPRDPETQADVPGVTTPLLPLLDLGEPLKQPAEDGAFRGLDAVALRAAAAQAALGTDPLQPSPVLTIDGGSLLPKAEAAAGRLRVEISDEVTRLAGKDAWWWGAAIADGFYYWAVRGDGHFVCDRHPIGEGTPAGQALAELLDATPGPGLQEQGTTGVLTGPLSGRAVGSEHPHDRERAFAWRLSEAFLPPPVRERAILQLQDQRQTSPSAPFQLVVSLPAALCRLPVALLALEPPTPQAALADVPRLIEAAVVHHAPSMALMASLVAQPPLPAPSPEKPWPLMVSVVDPTDDLRYAHGGDAPQVLLVGSRRLREQVRNSDSKAQLATKAALQKALLDLPSRAGLLLYAGHAHPGHPDAPATGGLVLASPGTSHPTDEVLSAAAMSGATTGAEQLLSARELLARNGQPSYPFPARVLLSACSTSGYGETTERIPGLAGEWLGVAAAVLHTGANEVVATQFDVPNVPGIKTFERRLVALLRSTPDAASAVQQAQVEALGEWRRSRHLPPLKAEGEWRLTTRLIPLIWVPYACLGGMER
jgi:CHAT domain